MVRRLGRFPSSSVERGISTTDLIIPPPVIPVAEEELPPVFDIITEKPMTEANGKRPWDEVVDRGNNNASRRLHGSDDANDDRQVYDGQSCVASCSSSILPSDGGLNRLSTE
ncbi:hypothetical protein HAX54_050496 [Datura stramonium]|uniref:Uncharacterized protein n=1 Tax=Datura stramonium TaxID=4076 RepID=A0ABS8WQC2_DATST|nr:hypothetical protein [Datura stramonium]